MVDSRDDGDDTIVHAAGEAEGPPTQSSGGAGAAAGQLAVVLRDRYETRARVAGGGVGRIIAVYDRRLDREVAIKELHEGSDLAAADRFVREALLTARLQHPNIVPVYEAGRWPSGEPFYAMKLVDGRPLSAAIAQAHGLAERLALLPHVIDCAQAVAFAHSVGVIHRDLKPANVLVGSFGETVVIDWGLAKELDDDRVDQSSSLPRAPIVDGDSENLTVTGTVIGTPAYMSPEQAAGKRVDARTDVYAIGAMLYHMLAGHPPYVGAKWIEVVGQVLLGPPPPIESLERNVPHELSAILGKAMARDAAARYRDAGELLVDLRAFQDGRIVGAHRYSAWQRTLRFARRFRTALAAAAVLVVVGSYALVASLIAQEQLATERDTAAEARDEAERQRVVAERARNQADAARREATARSDESTLERARSAARRVPNEALALLKTLTPEFTAWGAAQLVAADAAAHGLVTYVRRCGEGEPPTSRCPRAELRSISFAADGTVIVTHRDGKVARHDAVTGAVIGELLTPCTARDAVEIAGADGLLVGCDDGSVRWVTAAGTQELGRHGDAVYTLTPIAGQRAVSMGLDFTLYVWAPTHGRGKRIATCSRARELGYAPLAIAGDAGSAICLDTPESVVVFDLDGRVLDRHDTDEVNLVAIDDTGQRVAWGTSGQGVTFWDRSAADRVRVWSNTGVSALALSPDGRRLALGTYGGEVRSWDLVLGTQHSTAPHAGSVASLEFVAADELLSVGGDGEAHRVVLGTGQVSVIAGGALPTMSTHIDRASRRLAVRTTEMTMWLWRAESSDRVVAREPVALTAIAGTDDPDRVLIGTAAGELLELSTETGVTKRLRVAAKPVETIAVGRRHVAAGDIDGEVVVWDRDWRERARHHDTSGIVSLDFDDAERRMALVHGSRAVVVLELEAGTSTTPTPFEGSATYALFLPDGRLAVASSGGELAVLSPTLVRERNIHAHEDEIWRLAVSDDGRMIASVGRDRLLVLYDVALGTHRVIEMPFGAFDVRFIEDGKRLLLRSRDYVLRRIEIATGAIGPTYVGHGGHVEDFDVEAGLPRFATASLDHTARIWDLASGEHRVLRGHTDSLSGVLLRPARGDVITIGRDGTVRRWADDVPTNEHALREWLDRTSADLAEEFE